MLTSGGYHSLKPRSVPMEMKEGLVATSSQLGN